MSSPWETVQVSLDAYDPDRVRAAVAQSLRALPVAGPAAPQEARSEVYSRVQQALEAELGSWYVLGGPRVGDETVDGWCWCHSFWGAWREEGDASSRSARTLEGVLLEVERARQWRLSVAKWVWARATKLTADTLQHDLADLVEHLTELGLHDAWYVHVHIAAVWFLEAAGHAVPVDLSDRLDAIASTHFTSWPTPPPGGRRKLAEEAGGVGRETHFDRTYPG